MSEMDRRKLARALTIASQATAAEILDRSSVDWTAQRVGMTGPPGAGKSSLIGMLAQRRLARDRSVGVLAIDPTSPISQGSLLGDRIRMDAAADDERLYIRSMASGMSHDGLCRNVMGLLEVFDQFRFDEVILETVGVGQVNYEARVLVDTLVLVLVPNSGDVIQAMKAGVAEMADIFAINKSDLPAAERTAAELKSVIEWRNRNPAWIPPVILTSTCDRRGVDELSAAIDAHFMFACTEGRIAQNETHRRRYRLRSLLLQRFEELAASSAILEQADMREAFSSLVRGLRL